MEQTLRKRWGVSRDLAVFATEEQMREAFQDMFNALAYHVTSKGGEGSGEWEGKYLNALPTHIEVSVDVENLDRKIRVICSEGESHFFTVFGEGTKNDGS